MIRHIQMIFSGKVENTGFRFYALRGATEMNIMGEVKQESGTILIEAEGQEEDLGKFTAWCKKGPVNSKISSFEKFDKSIIGYQDFKIL